MAIDLTYEDDQSITEEKIVRSWSKPDGIHDLIGRKKVDLSIFKYGSHVPLQFIEDFDQANGGYHLSRGESKDIVLHLDTQLYNAKLVNEDRKGFNKDTVRILWQGNSELIALLRNQFRKIYQQLLDSNTSKTELDISFDNSINQYGYIDFLKTGIPFEYEMQLHMDGSNNQNTDGNEVVSKHIVDIFQEIMDKYQSARSNEPFGGNHPIRKTFEQLKLMLSNQLILDDDIQIKWSVGQGNWANVPWIAFLDKRETSSTQKGIYIVYLFCEDMSGFYLTLNQGVTEVINQVGINRKDAREILRTRAHEIQMRYQGLQTYDFKIDDQINLHSNSELGKNYEYGTITYKYYRSGGLSNDRALIQDLKNLLNIYHAYIDFKIKNVAIQPPKVPSKPFIMDEKVSELIQTILSQGYTFEPWQIATYVCALKTKPFVILAGVSGTGKSKLPSLIAKATGAERLLIPVRPDWTDSSDVLGYCNLQGNFRPGSLLSFAKDAEVSKGKQFVCIMDEMNLARVEHYFAEVLSQIEDRHTCDSGGFASYPLINQKLRDEDQHWAKQGLPANLAIVGTVNMDESAHGFSRKVLDRAFTIEFSEINLYSWEKSSDDESGLNNYDWPIEAWYPRAIRLGELSDVTDQDREAINQVVKALTEINEILIKAQLQVGFRIRDELALFVLHARDMISSFVDHQGNKVDPLDTAIQMKVLPRIIGGSSAIRQVVMELLAWSTGQKVGTDTDAQSLIESWMNAGRPSALPNAKFPRTAARLCLMWDRLMNEGFTSFWM